LVHKKTGKKRFNCNFLSIIELWYIKNHHQKNSSNFLGITYGTLVHKKPPPQKKKELAVIFLVLVIELWYTKKLAVIFLVL
jgi:hypothetical protein